MAIHIVTGRPGQGKTYILARKASEFLKTGRNVYSNFSINYKGENLHYWRSVKELVDVENGVILMDEAQIYFNSRNWSSLDERLQYKLQQHRKDGLDIWGTVQDIKRLDTVMRELVSNYYECVKFGSGENAKRPWGFIWLREFNIRDADKIKRKSFSSHFFLIRKFFCNFYDTLQKISYPDTDQNDENIRMVKMHKCSLGHWHTKK